VKIYDKEQLRRAMRSDAGLNQEFNAPKPGQCVVLETVVAEPARVDDQREWKDLMRELRQFVAVGLPSKVSR
jgi:hypothetical protein